MSSSARRLRSRSSTRLSPSSSVGDLSGVGEKRLDILRSLGVETVGNLLTYPPVRYIDRQSFARISNLRPGEVQTVAGKVASVDVRFIRGRRMTVATISDGSGKMRCVWFSQPYLRRLFKPDSTYVFSGTVRFGRQGFSMVHPEYEQAESQLLHTGRIVPVYKTRSGLSQRQLRRLVKSAVDACANEVADHVPGRIRQELRLAELSVALRNLHFPSDLSRAASARRRLAFDEMLLFQTLFALSRKERRSLRHADGGTSDVIGRFTSRLPYRLTAAQELALGDILADLGGGYPMRRLLQGDVGCGKTVVAALAAAVVAGQGRQVAILCPTELLADQHFATFGEFLKPLGFPVGLLSASTPAGDRTGLEEALASGGLRVVVGTHALMSRRLAFENLGLVIVDEEQRFGVLQRTQLLRHAPEAGLIVISATPIPRTLALTAYGDLDVTIVAEMPPGRGEHTTRVVPNELRGEALDEIARKINAGLRGFYVCPAVEESAADLVDVRTVRKEMEGRLRPGRVVDVLTGRTSRDKRASLLEDFVADRIGLVVATTVVEVGMDLPAATLLIVDQAERFGLAQLHQMRGRVSRTAAPSYSYFLVSDEATDRAWARLRALEATRDGFKIAEEDLALRGPGDLVGTRQHGIPDLKFALLPGDMDLMLRAREEAFANVLCEDTSPEWIGWIGAVRKAMEGEVLVV
jgi:ATP-dependent DNA helicase RecG